MFSHKATYEFRSELNALAVLSLFIVSLLTGVICQSEYGDNSKDYLPTSGLCWSNTSETCSHQVASFNLTDEACRMIFREKNSTSCSDENFKGDIDADYEFSQLSLMTYLYKDGVHRIPAFNLTFSHIKWTSMRMRFKENDAPEVKRCREFVVSPDIAHNFYFYFDCLWNNESYQNKPYFFQYLITTKSGNMYLYKYYFRVPDSTKMDESVTKIRDWEVFSVIDVTVVTSKLSLTVQAVPILFNVTTYKIQVFHQHEDIISVIGEHTEHHDPQIPSFRYSHEINSKAGSYWFAVTFEHPDCNQQCFVSNTSSIIIVDLPTENHTKIFFVVLVLVMVFIISYLLWMRNNKSSKPAKGDSAPPKFLLVYNPVTVDHINSMVEVAKFFKLYHLQVMIDVLGIPESNHKDPNKWYIEAFNAADFIGIFSSPKFTTTDKGAVKKRLIYNNTHEIARNFLKHKLSDINCKFFRIKLPHTCWDTLPEEAKMFKGYSLPQDLKSLLEKFGVVPQTDSIKHFEETLANTDTERDILVLSFDDKVETVEVDSIMSTTPKSSPVPPRYDCCSDFSLSEYSLDQVSIDN